MIVETPRGSNIKLEYEPKLRAFTVSRALARSKLEKTADLPARLKGEIEQFFLSATFFTDKRAKVTGWRGPKAAHKLVNASLTGG